MDGVVYKDPQTADLSANWVAEPLTRVEFVTDGRMHMCRIWEQRVNEDTLNSDNTDLYS